MEYIREANMELSCGLDIGSLQKAYNEKSVLCHRALVYEKNKGLHFNLGGYKAIMPTDDVCYTPDGSPVKEAAVVTRINKNVCFMITDIKEEPDGIVIYISRKAVQKIAYENYISKLRPGDIIPCCVTHVDSFGVFCDVGCGISALLPIDFISVSRINSPRDRFEEGQNIYSCIKNIGNDGRIVLTHKELLGTWLENAKMFKPQTTATGIVRSVEDYGIFIELSPNLAGLAETCEGIEVGDIVNVYIKSIIPDKMKVKLVIMSTLKNYNPPKDIMYFSTEGHIDRWNYSTENSKKQISTDFE